MAVQTDTAQTQLEECMNPVTSSLHCDAGVQTDQGAAATSQVLARWSFSPDKVQLDRFNSPLQGVTQEPGLRISQATMQTPDQVPLNGISQSTPDFGEMELSFAASQLKRWQEPVPSDLEPIRENWIRNGLSKQSMKKCGADDANVASASKAACDADLGQLKQQLQAALARGLTQLHRLQILAG